MEKFIEVHDNIINPTIVKGIEDKLLNQLTPYYYFNNIASENFQNATPGMVHLFFSFVKDNIDSTHQFYFFQILYTLANHLNFSIEEIIYGRSFLQLPSSIGPSQSEIHKDLNFPHWVCLYYVNDSDGDTVFFDDNKKEIRRISPKKGRIAFFDGSIYHASSQPKNSPRSIINIDFIGKKLG